MIAIGDWCREFTQKLRDAFGPALLFAGLQGSYGRGEAGPDSDIDMVVVLEDAGPAQRRAYRELVRSMPDADKACGFLCSRAALESWPEYDRLFLYLDTTPLVGRLEDIAPLPDKAGAAREAVRIGAANLYHAACHSALYDAQPEAALPGLRKAAFFTLRAAYYARTGRFVRARRELVPLLDGQEQALLDESTPAEAAVTGLLAWSEAAMQAFMEPAES